MSIGAPNLFRQSDPGRGRAQRSPEAQDRSSQDTLANLYVYRCSLCSKTFSTEIHLGRHRNRAHKSVRSHPVVHRDVRQGIHEDALPHDVQNVTLGQPQALPDSNGNIQNEERVVTSPSGLFCPPMISPMVHPIVSSPILPRFHQR